MNNKKSPIWTAAALLSAAAVLVILFWPDTKPQGGDSQLKPAYMDSLMLRYSFDGAEADAAAEG